MTFSLGMAHLYLGAIFTKLLAAAVSGWVAIAVYARRHLRQCIQSEAQVLAERNKMSEEEAVGIDSGLEVAFQQVKARVKQIVLTTPLLVRHLGELKVQSPTPRPPTATTLVAFCHEPL